MALVTHLSNGAVKKGNELETKVYNLKTKKYETIRPLVLKKHYVAYPNEFKKEGDKWIPNSKKIKVLHQNKSISVPVSKVEYLDAYE